jgi:hypothetical protein
VLPTRIFFLFYQTASLYVVIELCTVKVNFSIRQQLCNIWFLCSSILAWFQPKRGKHFHLLPAAPRAVVVSAVHAGDLPTIRLHSEKNDVLTVYDSVTLTISFLSLHVVKPIHSSIDVCNHLSTLSIVPTFHTPTYTSTHPSIHSTVQRPTVTHPAK